MQIIPAINCNDFDCVRNKFERAGHFLPDIGWLHVDVTDGKFTYNETWGEPEELASLKLQLPDFKPNIEVHLMVENPEAVIEAWIQAGVRRVIVHLEAVTDLDLLLDLSRKHNVSLMISSNPETPGEGYNPYFERCAQFQVLSVHPGLAAQKFLPLTLEKVRFLRKQAPDAKIEIDGGMNLETAKLAKEAGADMVASASYIFDSVDPKEAYAKLASL